MAFDFTTIADYSWAQIKQAAKVAMVQSALGGATLSIGGRTIGRISIEEARKLYEFADAQLAAESSDGGGIALVNFGERQ